VSPAARSVQVFGFVLVAQGLGLMLVPDVLLGLFGLPGAQDAWPRIAGWIALVLGYYYLRAAAEEVTPFFRWTAGVRIAQVGFFATLVALGMARPTLMLTSLVELASGVWTVLALRRQPAPRPLAL
jgi:hypothetical protein